MTNRPTNQHTDMGVHMEATLLTSKAYVCKGILINAKSVFLNQFCEKKSTTGTKQIQIDLRSSSQSSQQWTVKILSEPSAVDGKDPFSSFLQI